MRFLLNTHQRTLLCLGLPLIPCNGDGGDSSSQANTTTSNTTNTVTQDRRIVADQGAVGINADRSSVSMTMTDHGAMDTAAKVSVEAIQKMGTTSQASLDASKSLSKTGYDMLKLNVDLAQHINDSDKSLVQQAMAQNQAAMQTVSSVVSKPLDMQDPKNILVAAGICAVAVVAVATFGKGK